MSEVDTVSVVEDPRPEAGPVHIQIMDRICNVAKKCDDIFTEAGVLAQDIQDLGLLEEGNGLETVKFNGRLLNVPVDQVPVLLGAVKILSAMVADKDRALAKALKRLKMYGV